MSPIIKLPGASKPKPKAKAKAKPQAAPKPAPAKSKAKPKPAAKSKPKAKAKPRAKRAATAAQTNGGDKRVAKDGRVLRMPKDLDPAILARFESQLSEAGSRVKEAKVEHDEAIDHVHSIVVEAQAAEIPMAIIEDITGISRQWLYKMSQFKGRKAGNGKSKPKPRAKAKPAAAKPTKPTPTAKRAASAANKTARGPAIKLA